MAARRSVQLPDTPSADSNRVKVPSWDLDPVWSLAPWPVTIQFGSAEVEIPAMSAAEWLAILMGKTLTLGEMLEVIPNVDDLLIKEDVSMEEINDLLADIITTVSGRQWWITLRLLGVTKIHWDTIGPEMITSVDAERVSLAAWMTVLVPTLFKSMDPKSVPMFIAQIQAPPPGTEAPQTQHKELTAREFLAMAG